MINLFYAIDLILFSDTQDYFGHIIKKHETITDNPPVETYVNKIEHRTVFKIKKAIN